MDHQRAPPALLPQTGLHLRPHRDAPARPIRCTVPKASRERADATSARGREPDWLSLGRAASSSRGGSLVLPPRPGWRDLAGRCWHARPPAASAANQPGTRAGKPAFLIDGRLRWLDHLPLMVSRHATVSTVPRFQGQDRPPRQQETTMLQSEQDWLELGSRVARSLHYQHPRNLRLVEAAKAERTAEH